MWLVLGLGNPGPEYAGTRHNVGFEVLDALAARHGLALDRQRHRAQYGSGLLEGHRVLLARPLTYMNLAGEAARPLLAYHGLTESDLIAIHDEADLPVGTVRVKSGGGVAGHKGLTSLVRHLGSADFIRVRVGIGRPEAGGAEMADFVLSRPTAAERARLAEAVEAGVEAVEAVIVEGCEAAMRRFNRRQPADPAQDADKS
ncbi:MAG: aminoacyl-tRNA hydrolase [Acidobacteriota bacterium]|nr:MAG: aminoacyl-tRNA hydrolase [Acidobacteriota bacterium]